MVYLLILGRRRRHIAAALGRNIQNIMNWIILIVAGLCEVGFTYCLGRAKSVEGPEWWICHLLENVVHTDANSINCRLENIIITQLINCPDNRKCTICF